MAEHNRYPLTSADRAEAVLRIIRARRARSGLFGAELFSDPGWDILLWLFVARLRQQRLTLGQLSTEVALSANLAGRWIDTLEQSDLVRLRSDHNDRGQIVVELSVKGAEAMGEWLEVSRDTERGSDDPVIDLLSRIRGDRE